MQFALIVGCVVSPLPSNRHGPCSISYTVAQLLIFDSLPADSIQTASTYIRGNLDSHTVHVHIDGYGGILLDCWADSSCVTQALEPVKSDKHRFALLWFRRPQVGVAFRHNP